MARSGPSRSQRDGDAVQLRMHRLSERLERLEAEFQDRIDAELAWSAERTLLRAMIDQVPDYLFAKDRESRFLVVNKAVAGIHGRNNLRDLVGRTDFDLHPRERAEGFFAVEQEIIRTGQPRIDMEEIVEDQVGATRWLASSKVALRDPDNEIIGLVGISRDVTENRQLERLREEQGIVLEMIAMNAPLESVLDRLVHLMETQLQGVFGSVLLLDEAGTHLRHGAAPSLPAEYSSAIDGVEIGPSVGSCGTAAYRRETVVVSDIAHDPLWRNFRDLAGRHGLRSCWSTPILSHEAAVLGTFAMYSGAVREPGPLETRLIEMTTRIAAIAIERKKAEERISFLARHDALTGLPNRSLLADRLRQAILQAERRRLWVSVCFVDLDNFKTVNDSLGHAAGDMLLKAVAERMAGCVRATDTVVRLGGDEFVILLVDQPERPDVISATLEALRAAIGEPVAIEGRTVHVTSSIGVATYPHDGADAETLLTNADAAMYKAKEAGRDGFQFYTAEMNTRAHERLALQEAMRVGIARSEFHLLYQPQIDIKSWGLLAVEALARWRHPALGVISPAQFIPLAEETGLIVPLGDWVLKEACRQNKAWQDAGLPAVKVSVNVSARQFHDRNWTARVRQALDESGLQARYLELELTESLLMKDLDQAIATMNELRALGVEFAIDDFGTGYSNLTALKALPASRLKIDKSFVRNLADDEVDRCIAAAVISLGQGLNMRVIAEGVETEGQLDFLRRKGCDEIQGFYFSRPVAPEALEGMLKLPPARSA